MTTDVKAGALSDARARLKQHFSEFDGAKYADGWADLWDKGNFLPWDKGFPNPALIDLLAQRHDLIGTAIVEDGESGKERRKKALVPGCGKGYDVLLLASFGYDAYGLEYSKTALNACEQEASENADKYPTRDAAVGKGSVQFVAGDFFKNNWLTTADVEGKFDLIYDYTFLSALNPSMRPAWAQRMSELLGTGPQCNFICIEFPTYKDPKTGGPPYALPSKVYFEHLSHPGEDIPYGEDGHIKLNPLRRASETGLERVAHWQPERTHEVGKDENGKVLDWVSVWRHKGR